MIYLHPLALICVHTLTHTQSVSVSGYRVMIQNYSVSVTGGTATAFYSDVTIRHWWNSQKKKKTETRWMLIMATDYQPRNLVVPLVKIHINRCIEENYRSIIGVSRGEQQNLVVILKSQEVLLAVCHWIILKKEISGLCMQKHWNTLKIKEKRVLRNRCTILRKRV